jgi:sulfur-carrier protein
VIRVVVPYHLRRLAQVEGELCIDVPPPVSFARVFDAIEQSYPALRGTIRDPATGRRRPLLRLFALGQDHSFAAPEELLPEAVGQGREPLLVVGAIAGG